MKNCRLKRNDIAIIPVAFIFMICSCSPVTLVRPLEKGKWVATGHLGGPLIGFGKATIPIPFTSIGAAYGLTDKTTAMVKLHTTSALYGVFNLEAGIVHGWRDSDRFLPGVSTNVQGSFLIDRWKGHARFYPTLDLNLWWKMRERGDFLYAGIGNWFELKSNKAFDEPQTRHWIPSYHLGYTMVKTKWNVGIETKFIAPLMSHEKLVVEYKTPLNTGALGVYLSFTKKF
jgi:hypothetical protein